MTVDYLIIGQGICGTFLSWNLLNEGKDIIVIDESRPYSSTKVASGVINPITGRRMAKTWMIEELLPFAKEAYQKLGEDLGVPLVKECELLMFHPTMQMLEAFDERYEGDKQYLSVEMDDVWKQYFNFYYGIGKITPCLHIDLNLLLEKWRAVLQQKNILSEQQFNNDFLRLEDDGISYKDIKAKKIIFCNGTEAFQLPYFDRLPYARNKGQAIIASIKDLPTGNIYKQSLSIVPWKDDLFWIGSTYEWNFDNLEPSESFRRKVEEQLGYWLKVPFTIVDHIASERPATLERRPFVGIHPVHSSVAILNGMGTKGCSLAPYFAKQLTQHLVHGSSITPEADVQRFRRILSQGTL